MNSLFLKYFLIYSLVIVFSFVILGGAYVAQVNRYAVEDKENTLEQTASRAAESTSSFIETAAQLEKVLPGSAVSYTQSYLINMMQLADISNGMIFVGDVDGHIMYIANRDGCYAQESGVLPQSAVSTVLEDRRFAELGTFNNYFSEAHLVVGVPFVQTLSSGETNDLGVIFVSVAADSSINFFFEVLSTFIVMVVVVLLLTLVVTYFIVHNTFKPLNKMAAAARSYARGDFTPRVPLPRSKHRDELYDVILSFNNMADSVANIETMRRGLIANVSHDLRTPMTTIAGFVDGILDGTIKPDRQEYYLRIISEEIKRLSRLASSMLEVSRLESGEKGLNKTTFDACEMVRRIIIGFEQKLTDKQIEVVLDIPETLNVSADHDALFQAVYNLIDNAVKFTPTGGQIAIYMSEKGGKMQCNVQNTGSEIAPENIKYIFDRFYKEDKSRGINKTGSGLGLYIVKTVINRHGGDIFAKSGDGKTEFCFSIPTS